MLRPPAPLSRRAALGALALASAGLSGCSFDTNSLKAPSRREPDPATEADRRLVASVRRTLRQASRGAPDPFRALHRTHLKALDVTIGASFHGKAPATSVVQRRERALPDALTAAAGRASSADLVRLFASMAAAQRQLLTLHPEVTS